MQALIKREGIRTVPQLLLRAQRLPELANFAMTHRRDLDGYIKTVWDIADAQVAVAEEDRVAARLGRTRVELLAAAATALPCVCGGSYGAAFVEITERQEVAGTLERAILHALASGRRKDANLYIHGDADCGKSFVLDPLRLVFSALVNPAPHAACSR